MEGTPSRGLGDGSLLERDRELGMLDGLVAGAAAGDAGLVVVEGGAGIGKSRLLSVARDRAADAGFRTLSARGTELEREFPYGAVRQLFEPLRAEPEVWARAFAGAAAGALPVFDAPVFTDGDAAGDTSFAALHGLYWLTANLTAEGPLLLAVDDLHWCDRPSLRFLAYLAPRLEGLPVLVVAGVRSGEPGTDPGLLADLITGPSTVAVTPGPLSATAVRGLVGERLGGDPEESFAGACAEATGGNPLLLRQLLTSLATEGVEPVAGQAEMVRAIGPRAVSRTILLRLARLDADAVATAHAVAVLGESAELRVVAAMAGLDEAATAAATRVLSRADILRPELPLAFAHPLVREAVYRDLGPAERELRHARAAELLIGAGAADDQVATQLLQAPRRGERRVVEILRSAARSAVQRGAADSADTYLNRALAEPAPDDLRPDLLLELAAVEERTNGPAALAHLREAYDGVTDPELRSRLAFQVAFLELFTGGGERAKAVLQRAIAELPLGSDDRLRLEALDLALVWFGIGDVSLLDRLREHREPGEGDGPGALLLTGYAAFDWAMRSGPAQECADLMNHMGPIAPLPAIEVAVLPTAVGIVLTLAEREDVHAHWAAAEDAARRRGSLFSLLGVRVWRAWTLLLEGELDDAESEMLQGREGQTLWGATAPAGTGQAAGVMASILMEQGRVEEARGVLAQEPIEETTSFGGLFRVRAEVELQLLDRRYEEALETATRELEPLRGWLDNPGIAPWRGYAAQALDGLGRTDEALALAQEELELARASGSPRPIGRVLRLIGTLRREEGLGTLEEAVDVLSGSRGRLEYAKALAALGAAGRRARRPTEAREPLRRALELAASCGAEPLAAEVRSELAASGVRPRSAALGGVESLTASERRVTALAAGGQTNRDIAQELYVTPKTVEVHLSNAYRKLGIRSRRDLSGALEPA